MKGKIAMSKVKTGLFLIVIFFLLMIPAARVKAESSGTCGDNVSWTLSDDGVLTISGTGEMKEYKSNTQVPWYSQCRSIKSIIIKKGVTSISSVTFTYCTNLTSVSIPGSVTKIGSGAFHRSIKLIEITLPNSLYPWV